MGEMLFAGQPGPKGEKGDRGEGMTRGARHAVIFLFCFSVLLSGASLLGSARYANSVVHAAQKATAAKAAAAVAAQQASAVAAQQAALCQAGNTARAEQVDLWTFIIHLSKPPRTAQQRQVIAEFEAHLRRVFAPRSCALPRPR